jgi:hypothetical protein
MVRVNSFSKDKQSGAWQWRIPVCRTYYRPIYRPYSKWQTAVASIVLTLKRVLQRRVRNKIRLVWHILERFARSELVLRALVYMDPAQSMLQLPWSLPWNVLKKREEEDEEELQQYSSGNDSVVKETWIPAGYNNYCCRIFDLVRKVPVGVVPVAAAVGIVAAAKKAKAIVAAVVVAAVVVAAVVVAAAADFVSALAAEEVVVAAAVVEREEVAAEAFGPKRH